MKNRLILFLLILSLGIFAHEQADKQKIVIEQIEEILEADYSFYDWALKGYNALSEGKYSDACFYYQKAIKLNPDDAIAYNNWGIALVNLAEQKDEESFYYKGIEKSKKSIELNPDYANAYNNWGIALTRLAIRKDSLEEKKDEIIELFNKTEIVGYESKGYNLACLYALLNEKETALAWLEKSLQYAGRLNREHYEQDEDFNNIKEDPQFKALLEKYFQDETDK